MPAEKNLWKDGEMCWSCSSRPSTEREGVTRIEKVADSQHSADAYMLAGKTLPDLDENDRARHDLEATLGLDPNLPGIQTAERLWKCQR